MVPQMSFKGLPSNSTKQVSFYYLFYYWTSLLRRHSHYLTLGHMKIPFKQLKKKSLAGSGLIEPVTVRQSRQKEGGRMSFQKVSGYNTGHLKRNRKSSQKVNEGFVSNIKQTKISLKRTGLNHSIKIYSFTKCITLKITLLS